jgi:hypothetical protein
MAKTTNRARGASRETVATWAFDSLGDRKYAIQIQRASNGNPCLRIVEGVPQGDGTFRKFNLTFWSEDWPRLMETLDTVRQYIDEHDIKTPEGHKYVPGKRGGNNGRGGRHAPHSAPSG